MKFNLPKILLFIILISLVAGHVFAVKEYTVDVPNTEAINLRDLDKMGIKYENYGPVQIIESPTIGREYKLVNQDENIEYENYGPIRILDDAVLEDDFNGFISAGDGKNCIFFDNEGIPWEDECLIQVLDSS